ncbi:hypothetical protein TH15_06360 [Thalassospira profundimaris]|nr:hypothetical protein TH15_06360 [Thalassospira profundimaris]
MVLLAAISVIGVGLSGNSLVAGCTSNLCNSIRTLQWEALTAGLLGLAGGFSVIVSTRKQILHSERVAQQQREDFLLADVNIKLADIENFCTGGEAFMRISLELYKENELNSPADEIIKLLYSEDGISHVRRVILSADEIRKSNIIPLPLQGSFDRLARTMNDLWRCITSTAFHNIPKLAAELERDIDSMRFELINYRKQILNLRLY